MFAVTAESLQVPVLFECRQALGGELYQETHGEIAVAGLLEFGIVEQTKRRWPNIGSPSRQHTYKIRASVSQNLFSDAE